MKPDTTNPDVYQRTFKVPKWNRFVRVTDVPRLLRSQPEFRDWSPAQHVRLSSEFLALMACYRRLYRDLLKTAEALYGDGNGQLISGVYRDHYPNWVKDQLRQAIGKANDYGDRSAAHWVAAGRRIYTWREVYREALTS